MDVTIKLNGGQFEKVNCKLFWYNDPAEGSYEHIRARIEMTTAGTAMLKLIDKTNIISIHAEITVFKRLALTNGCERWTMIAHIERRLQTFQMKSLRRILI